jgi:hypothetical protein
MAGRAFKEPFITLQRSPPRGGFGLNFQAGYGCPVLKEQFLSLKTLLPLKAFLALNS